MSSSDSDESENVESDATDGWSVDILDKHPSFTRDITSYRASSESSLDLSESGSEETDFHPELFGLLDNPGVVRFGCVDYPLAVTEYSDDEHNTAPDWIRVSYDDLNLDINTAGDIMEDINSDSKILSRSVDDINNTTFYSDLPMFRTFDFFECHFNKLA